MSDVFGSDYAALYDVLYADKDYAAETETVARAFADFAGGEPISRVLDLGTGTGRHAVELARRGFEVTGVDRSAAMLERARERALAAGVDLRLEQGDLRSIDLAARFDAATMLFAVLGYQTTNDELLAALANARNHLRAGGLLLFDVWYGPAVLAIRPSERVRVSERDGALLVRVSSGELDARRQICRVTIRVWRSSNGAVSSVEERHDMRYFFPQELALALRACGFDLVRLSAFPDVERDADESTWSAFIVARAT